MNESSAPIMYSWEPFLEGWAAVRHMADAHFRELAHNREHFRKPELNEASYVAAEKRGILHGMVVRRDLSPIGYFLMFVGPDLHYKVIVAQEDTYYLLPEYRGQGIGSRMFDEAERRALELGAQVLRIKTRKAHDNSALLERKGFTAGDTIYQKILRRKPDNGV